MAYPQVLIPPSIRPESPSEPQLLDEQSTVYSPRFGRGTTQRQLWGDPLWGWKLRYRGLSASDRARLRAVILDSRGKGANIRVTPGMPLRGSFPATELITNNEFASGTTGWSAQNSVLSSSDSMLRVTASVNSSASPAGAYQNPTLAAYVPYALRAYASVRDSSVATNGPYFVDVSSVGPGGSYTAIAQALKTTSLVASAAGAATAFVSVLASGGYFAGAYSDVTYTSVARCMLVDNGPNALTYSDQIDNAAWTKGGVTVAANTHTSLDGTVTTEKVTEDTSTGAHYIYRVDGTRANAAADLCAYGVFGASALDRDVRLLICGDAAFTNYAVVTLDISAGTLGSVSLVGSATNGRAFVKSMGSGYYAVWIIARFPAGTAITTQIDMINAGSGSYTGTTGAIAVWRWGACASSVPVKLSQTVAASTTGSAQSGGVLSVKGLPVSTNGLLLPGDFIEVGGELKQVTSSLNSDSAGLGVLQFRPGLWVAPADNDPVIVLNPMGQFMLASDPRITENFGLYTDIELDLVEAGA